MDISYYEVLGVDKDATPQTIKKAYHNLSRKHHPDKLSGADKLLGEEKIKLINEAYGVLSDPQKRQIYDKYGKEGLDEGSMFNHGQMPFSAMRKQHIVPPVETTVQLTLEDIYKGKEVNISFERRNICKHCDRTGTKDKIRHPCSKCKGQGHFIQQIYRGFMFENVPVECGVCKGLGIQSGIELCDQCGGKLYETEKYTLPYNIPAGFCTTNEIEISNLGHEIPPEMVPPNVTRGSVFIIIEEIEHPTFKHCSPIDLFISINISIEEALCGFKRVIKHLDDRNLAIIVTDPINNRDRKVIKHEGMPNIGNPSSSGNLIIEFIVNLPNNLTDQQKSTIFSCLTNGRSLESVDLSLGPDEVYTTLVSQSEIPIETDANRPNTAECNIQ